MQVTDRNSKSGHFFDSCYLQIMRLKTIYYGLRVKLVVFMTLTNCFRKNLWISYVFYSFFILFVVQRLSQPNQGTN